MSFGFESYSAATNCNRCQAAFLALNELHFKITSKNSMVSSSVRSRRSFVAVSQTAVLQRSIQSSAQAKVTFSVDKMPPLTSHQQNSAP